MLLVLQRHTFKPLSENSLTVINTAFSALLVAEYATSEGLFLHSQKTGVKRVNFESLKLIFCKFKAVMSPPSRLGGDILFFVPSPASSSSV